MSGKLDQSLDEIVSTHRRTGAPRRGRRVHVPRGGAKAAATPVGGVKKTTKPVGKNVGKGVPTGPTHGSGESRVLVSGLPKDVAEQQIKDYFAGTVGPVKRVELAYGASGVSRGIATIIFVRSESAAKAIKVANGISIDGKPIKIDIILDAARAAAIPPPKGLSERVTAPKSQPKSAALKLVAKSNDRGGKAKGRGGRGGRTGRPAKKTAEQLDSEMADYWATGTGAESAATGSAAPATTGDAPMDDEIL